jgi:hypothetical protein
MIRYYFTLEGLPKTRHLGYLICLYLCLVNGSRCSEGLEGFQKWINNGNRSQEVRVRKQKQLRMRKILVPPEILDEYRFKILEYDIKFYRATLGMFGNTCSGLGFNCHSLRYSFISYCAMQNISPLVIAGITKHKNLNLLISYSNAVVGEKVAEAVKRRLIYENEDELREHYKKVHIEPLRLR